MLKRVLYSKYYEIRISIHCRITNLRWKAFSEICKVLFRILLIKTNYIKKGKRFLFVSFPLSSLSSESKSNILKTYNTNKIEQINKSDPLNLNRLIIANRYCIRGPLTRWTTKWWHIRKELILYMNILFIRFLWELLPRFSINDIPRCELLLNLTRRTTAPIGC